MDKEDYSNDEAEDDDRPRYEDCIPDNYERWPEPKKEKKSSLFGLVSDLVDGLLGFPK